MLCKICGSRSNSVFEKTVLGKYPVRYWQCAACGFIQTDTPFWLEEAYSSAIASLDIGILDRNLYYSSLVSKIIDDYLSQDPHERFLDFAGGYGILVRLMRDKGYNFYRHDRYCQNLFAQHFDIGEEFGSVKYTMITAFEVMEHLIDPFKEISFLANTTDELIFSTELQPQNSDIESWWYLSPETGQHISFFTRDSLEFIAKKLNRHYLNYANLHWLSTKQRDQKKFSTRIKAYLNPKKKTRFQKIQNRLFRNESGEVAKITRKSLLQSDFEMIRKGLFK